MRKPILNLDTLEAILAWSGVGILGTLFMVLIGCCVLLVREIIRSGLFT